MDWLRRCSNLIECEIHICSELGTRLPPPTMVHLPLLINLQFTQEGVDENAENFGNVFNGLMTPALSELRIESQYQNPVQWAQPQFVSFLSRSACALRKLDLDGIPISDFQLIEILRMLPSLVELVINDDQVTPRSVTNILLQQLTHRPPNVRSLPLLSPQLQSINFQGRFEVDSQIFGDMVTSRWRIHESMGADDLTFEITRLKTMMWKLCGSLDEETRARLKKYSDEGLELDMLTVIS